ncbi:MULTISPECIES: MFS transporter [Microbacteriaceae]|uniref:MFS transporter n=1 Tax=Microbacteriaceae TaxID=85023 RepID=UPI000381FD43|nr:MULTISPECIES: MFS transporter [Microbacteriaceae]TDQ02279.1 Na+/melibiose symporter-like transporter [Leifsonia sp. 115AMFTsu3.1]SDL93591.1 Na+/melibiose symporter [Microbacterium azadirachtae]SEG14343.1 Na+/melibiose symporter [Microbacterium azadirachtae]SEG16904.1 Na+/melibiose symporter [Microbacterium azadirachtae]
MTNASSEAAPKTASNAVQYQVKTRAMRRYITFYSLASLGIALLWGSLLAILVPLQVQGIEFHRIFTGADSGVDLQALTTLQSKVAAGTVTPDPDQQRQLGLLAEFNSSRATSLSIVSSVGVLLGMLLSPIIGMLSDRTKSRWGRRAPWIAAGGIGGTALICLMPVAPTIAVMVVIWSLLQVLVGVAQGPLTATVADRVPEARIGVVSGISGLASYFGAIIGAVAAGSLFASIGLAAYFPIGILLLLTTMAFVLFARDNTSREMITKRLRFKSVVKSYGVALGDADYRWAWISKVLLYLGYGISSVYSLYMLQSYISPALSATQAAQTAPLLQFAALPTTLLAMFISGRWSDKIKRRKPFVVAAGLLMAGSFLIPFISPTLPAMFIQVMVTGLGYGTFVVVDQALFIDVLPDKEAAGRDLGLSSLGQNLGNALGPIVAGAVVGIFAGAYAPVWPIAFALVTIASLLVLRVKRVR